MARNFEMFERYNFIIEQLEKADWTATELSENFVRTKKDLTDNDKNVGKSAKTFKRDIEDLKGLFFEFGYDKQTYKYSLTKKGKDVEKRIFFLKQLSFFSDVTRNKESTEYIDFERSNMVNDKYREEILKACQTKNILKLRYESHWHNATFDYEVAPYMLKLFRNRWYLIGKITKSFDDSMMENKNVGKINRFPLERIRMETTEQHFEADKSFDPKTFYEDSFGIMESLSGNEAQEVELLFEPIQGRYVKNLPLHHSQKTESEDNGNMLVSLKIHITYDFVQEILHFGETVKVLAPQILKDLLRDISAQMNSYYAEDKDVKRSDLY